MRGLETRDAIIETADRLFYRNGFANSSLADIADAVAISRGNFYYHFRTKDTILDAVIERRLAATRTMLAGWAEETDYPKARIRRFMRILDDNSDDIMLYGCPVGTLSMEMAKLDHACGSGARQLFDLFRDWLKAQFAALGRGAEADALALHVLMRSQGIAVLFNAYRDPAFVRAEIAAFDAWLDRLDQSPTSFRPNGF